MKIWRDIKSDEKNKKLLQYCVENFQNVRIRRWHYKRGVRKKDVIHGPLKVGIMQRQSFIVGEAEILFHTFTLLKSVAVTERIERNNILNNETKNLITNKHLQ